ncbi:hypothetical protein ACJJIG_02775 [Microbulbifer sp. SSSA007]|uniref:hypothetical protein n=1 Tax=Microbulbifer TaxID=48073 RepID=UPI00039D5EB7|nr:hypothetical protein [Microbulbifer variabilis]
MSVLSGQTRYARLAWIATDPATTELLSMTNVVSDGSVRRVLLKLAEKLAKDLL